MAFGTGHHETTSLIIEELLDELTANKSLLDMGCGTSILILARMRGARPCNSYRYRRMVCTQLHRKYRIESCRYAVSQEMPSSLTGKGPFDIIIANINRNILNDMKQYVACMHPGSELLMSGFYVDDIAVIREEAERTD